MLYSIDSQTYINNIPHKNDYDIWIGRLSFNELNAIISELNNRIDSDEIHTSSWMPGSDWSNTVFHPIYETACRNSEIEAGKCFGLILWVVLMNHADVWSFGRYEKNGVPIEGMTYFRLRNPPTLP